MELPSSLVALLLLLAVAAAEWWTLIRFPNGEDSPSSSSSNGGRLGAPSRERGRELKLVTVAPGVGEREGKTSGAEIVRFEYVWVSVGTVLEPNSPPNRGGFDSLAVSFDSFDRGS